MKRQWQAPWEAMSEIQERPSSMQEMLTASPLGGDIREVGVPTMNA
jgi:hypothetical protein